MYFEIDNYNALKEALHRMCAGFFAEDVPDGVVFDSRLVAHELLINALRYGGGRAYFTVERTGDEIRISVRSANAYRPPEEVSRADVTEERGRGLYLVDSIATARAYSEAEGISVVLLIEK